MMIINNFIMNSDYDGPKEAADMVETTITIPQTEVRVYSDLEGNIHKTVWLAYNFDVPSGQFFTNLSVGTSLTPGKRFPNSTDMQINKREEGGSHYLYACYLNVYRISATQMQLGVLLKAIDVPLGQSLIFPETTVNVKVRFYAASFNN